MRVHSCTTFLIDNGTGHVFECSTKVEVKAGFNFRVGTAAADIAAGVENGCLYYNTATHKLRLRANGAWVDLN
jgi:hypothetical protein